MNDSQEVVSEGPADTPPVPLSEVTPQELGVEHTSTTIPSPTVRVTDVPSGTSESSSGPVTPSDWLYAEGIPGTGEKPEWFNDKTYKTLADQAKAQPELRKRLASFTGAPEEGYEIALGEDLQEAFQFDEEDPVLNQFAEMAQEMNMSQDGFNQMLQMYANEAVKIDQEEKQEMQEYWKGELNKLGQNGVEELKILKQWSRNALPEELQETFDEMVVSADVVKIFQTLIDKTVPTQLTHVAPGTGLSRQHLQELMKNVNYGRDPDFTRHVDAEGDALYGRTKIYD